MQQISTDHQKPFQAKFSSKLLIAYLYFIQGIALALCTTIPLTYKKLPSYQILGYFSAAVLPFSFKFITAPLIEKYSFINYGRRKFWVVLSMAVACVIMYFISGYIGREHKKYQLIVAALLFVVGLCVSVQDISTDALSVKQLRKPQLASMLQSIMQQAGLVMGSMLMGELTSDRLAKSLGYSQALISSSSFIKLLIPLILCPVVFIHFYFIQTSTEKQQTIRRLSLWQVITHYRHFILPKYRVCRQALLFLTMYQGLTIFTAGYSIELINNEILTKQFIISLSNFSLLIVFPATYLFSKYVSLQNLQQIQRYLFSLRCLLCCVLYLLNSDNANLNSLALFLLQLLGSLHFYLHGIIMNSFEDSKFQGMSVTMMASMSNLGRNSTLQLNLIGQFGFRQCCFYSFLYDAVILLTLKPFHRWIKKGRQQQEDYLSEPHEHED